MAKQDIEAVFDRYILDRKQGDEAWIITYKGKRMQLASGKLLWNKKGHAMNAMTNFLKEFEPRGYVQDVNGTGWVRNPAYGEYWDIVNAMKESGELKVEELQRG